MTPELPPGDDAGRRTPTVTACTQGSPDLALAIRPRYADHRHLGHAAPPAKLARPGITLHRP